LTNEHGCCQSKAFAVGHSMILVLFSGGLGVFWSVREAALEEGISVIIVPFEKRTYPRTCGR
jgi:hypothetical protein